MKIAILNYSFLAEEQLQRLRKLGEVSVYDKTDTEELLVERLRGVDVAVVDCFEAPLDNPRVFENMPSVKLLSLNSTGIELIDMRAATINNIRIAHVPGFSTESVAEHTFALLLAAMRHIPKGDAAMRKAPFQIDPADREHDYFLGANLKGKVLGVIGLGQIGQRVAELGMAFGMEVISYNHSPKNVAGTRMTGLDELLRESDVVTLNVSPTDDSNQLINASKLKLMKKTAFLINTARSGVVDDEALAEALQKNEIAGAGLDFIKEWNADNPLLMLDNVVFSPHDGWFTEESLYNMADTITNNI